ncbi:MULTISPECIES: hypothetical protein [Streptomyces]|uniref:hypothetical protein n=1 Tax=Streptomyces TaxID=1883 RepID=UPI0006EB69E1|nr:MULTISPECIES: hypothetical protein [Streptomyces]
MTVDLSFFHSETSQRLRAEGRAEDILRILDRRGIEVPDPARERVTTCTDLDTLGTWLDRALTITTAEELFTEPTA